MRNEKKHSRTQPRNADNNNMRKNEKNALTPLVLFKPTD